MATPVDNQDVSKAVGEDVGSDGSIYSDDEMVDVSVLSSAAVFSALVCVSVSSASGSTSLTPVNLPFSFYTGSSLSPAL
ncbi:hypothetical protein I7I48_10270 [Histoplasma ohiense]|nr:hypothetical protein I7I48_10270 [Histoplasma ohiense (nom. inval.)]